ACNLCHLDQTLAWTAEKLHAWYNQPMADLSRDDQTIAAAVQWILQGDAGQRVLMAWGFGWESAQKIAGRDWLYPYLIYSLTDPYAAVRFDAWKSLQTLPGFSNFSFNYTVTDSVLSEAAGRAYEKWLHEVRNPNAVYRLRRCSIRMDVGNKIFSNAFEPSATTSGFSWQNEASNSSRPNHQKERRPKFA